MIKLKDLLKEVSEGGPGSGKKKTGRAPKLQEPWKEPHVPVKNKSRMPRKSRSKYSDPTRRQVRSTKGKRAPKLENSQINEADHRKEAWDVLAQVKKDLKTSYITVKDLHKRFPLKGGQVSLSNSAIEKINTAWGWVDKLMKDIARG